MDQLLKAIVLILWTNIILGVGKALPNKFVKKNPIIKTSFLCRLHVEYGTYEQFQKGDVLIVHSGVWHRKRIKSIKNFAL